MGRKTVHADGDPLSCARCVRTWGATAAFTTTSSTYEPGFTAVENSLGYKTSDLHDGAMVTKTVDAYGKHEWSRCL